MSSLMFIVIVKCFNLVMRCSSVEALCAIMLSQDAPPYLYIQSTELSYERISSLVMDQSIDTKLYDWKLR